MRYNNKRVTAFCARSSTSFIGISSAQAAAGLQHVTANSFGKLCQDQVSDCVYPRMFGFTRIGFDSFGMDLFLSNCTGFSP